MGEILAVVITMGARELVCGEREREERRRGEKQVSGTETFVKMWYINVRSDATFLNIARVSEWIYIIIYIVALHV